MTQILAVIGLILTCAIGIWKRFSRIRAEKRKLADEAQKEYEEALKSGDTSRITAALARLNRL
jgi:hypothetical protein